MTEEQTLEWLEHEKYLMQIEAEALEGQSRKWIDWDVWWPVEEIDLVEDLKKF